MAACPPSPAAGQKTLARNAGTSITVTCASARSRSALAILSPPIRGNGAAASIPALCPATARPAPRPASVRRATPSSWRGGSFSPIEQRRTSTNTGNTAPGQPGNTRCGIRDASCPPNSQAAGPHASARSDRHQGLEPARPRGPHGSRMKFVEPSRLTDPDAAARKLVQFANAIEPARDGRIYISSRSTAHSSRPVARRISTAPESNARLHRAGSGCMSPGHT
jgi:hypothetical protein